MLVSRIIRRGSQESWKVAIFSILILGLIGRSQAQVTATSQPGVYVTAKSATVPAKWELTPTPPDGSIISSNGNTWTAWLLPGPGSYRLIAHNVDGTFTGRVITVGGDVLPIPATPVIIASADTNILVWSVTNAKTILLNESAIPPTGTKIVGEGTYVFKATNDAGTSTKTVTVGSPEPGPGPTPPSVPWICFVNDKKAANQPKYISDILASKKIRDLFIANKWLADDGEPTFMLVDRTPIFGTIAPQRRKWIETATTEANNQSTFPVMVYTLPDGTQKAEPFQISVEAQIARIEAIAKGAK